MLISIYILLFLKMLLDRVALIPQRFCIATSGIALYCIRGDFRGRMQHK
ncbi:hypothetical protein GLYMA_06G323550v4 [Glycine max]|nr:hypothetical protein GLYMA_06G323550v4 [Glycine max]KAH1128595.1 hypothetical protein GYH30_016910 [Glycine max]